MVSILFKTSQKSVYLQTRPQGKAGDVSPCFICSKGNNAYSLGMEGVLPSASVTAEYLRAKNKSTDTTNPYQYVYIYIYIIYTHMYYNLCVCVFVGNPVQVGLRQRQGTMVAVRSQVYRPSALPPMVWSVPARRSHFHGFYGGCLAAAAALRSS